MKIEITLKCPACSGAKIKKMAKKAMVNKITIVMIVVDNLLVIML
jgi:hypothetical protein